MKSPDQQPKKVQSSTTDGSPWPFRFLIIVVIAALLMLIGKAIGLF